MTSVDRKELASLNDPLLHALLRAEGPEIDAEVERLILDNARPVIDTVLARYTRSRTLISPEDADDVLATIHLRLLEKLRSVAVSDDDAIQNFQGYVATLSYNAVNDWLRKRFPERARLKNRVRNALTNDARLAMWSSAAGPAGGVAAQAGGAVALDRIPSEIADDPAIGREESADALVGILTAAREPVLIDAIVDFVAELWAVTRVSAAAPPREDAVSREPDTAARVEDRDFARALWDEIRALRPMQRKALLLNLRYGGDLDILSVLTLSGIASFCDLAAVLEMSEEELAAIWKELPIEDLRIAAMLNITRQQVINLRKSARDRLSRRLPR
jgi:RNA polymerase sigma factor (sigma-70 family)